MSWGPDRGCRSSRAFTLIELLAAMAVIALLLLIIVQITSHTGSLWQYTAGKAEQFRQARTAFETMTRRISQATLNTYWDYNNPDDPTAYARQSELRFVSGPMQLGVNRLDYPASSVPRPTHGVFFQAPFGFVAPGNATDTISPQYKGLESLLNTWGYFLEVNDDSAQRPPFIDVPPRIRSRLMEMMEPAGMFSVYKYTSGQTGVNPTTVRSYAGLDWFRTALPQTFAPILDDQAVRTHILAENIVALAILPKLADYELQGIPGVKTLSAHKRDALLAPGYFYHSATMGEAKGIPSNASSTAALQAALNSLHQLPPVLQIAMVAIDKASAQRLNVTSVNEDPLGVRSTTFLKEAMYWAEDLQAFEERLSEAHVNYRVFTTNIHLRGARWSKDQRGASN